MLCKVTKGAALFGCGALLAAKKGDCGEEKRTVFQNICMLLIKRERFCKHIFRKIMLDKNAKK